MLHTLRNVHIGARKPVRSGQGRVHGGPVLRSSLAMTRTGLAGAWGVSPYRFQHTTEGLQLSLHVLLLLREFGEGQMRRIAVRDGPRRGPRGDRWCVEVLHSQQKTSTMVVGGGFMVRQTMDIMGQNGVERGSRQDGGAPTLAAFRQISRQREGTRRRRQWYEGWMARGMMNWRLGGARLGDERWMRRVRNLQHPQLPRQVGKSSQRHVH